MWNRHHPEVSSLEHLECAKDTWHLSLIRHWELYIVQQGWIALAMFDGSGGADITTIARHAAVDMVVHGGGHRGVYLSSDAIVSRVLLGIDTIVPDNGKGHYWEKGAYPLEYLEILPFKKQNLSGLFSFA